MRFLFGRKKRAKDTPALGEATNAAPDTALKEQLSGRVAFMLSSSGPIVDVVLPPPPRVVVASFNIGGGELDGPSLDVWLRRGAAGDGSPAAVVLVGLQEASHRAYKSTETMLARHLVDHERVPLAYEHDDARETASARRIGLQLFCFVAKGWRCAAAAPARYVNLALDGAQPAQAFKGALAARVGLRSDLGDDRAFEVCAVVAHLPAHEGRAAQRVKAIGTIQEALGDYVARADAAFFFGDLNFRVDPRDDRDAGAFRAALKAAADLSRDEGDLSPKHAAPAVVMEDDPEARSAVMARVAAGDFAAILAWDELGRLLAHVRRKRGAFAAAHPARFLTWRDAPCDGFAPTFKVLKGAAPTVYSEKRIPAYTDRVLYRGRATLADHAAAHGVALSDHKPTRATFALGDEAPRETPRKPSRRGSLGTAGAPRPAASPLGLSPGVSNTRLSPGVSNTRHAAWEPP